MQTAPYDSQGLYVFMSKSRRNSRGHAQQGAPITGGVGSIRRFLANILLYLRNSAR